tara:strand:- start:727 stop:3858 length:3132 start_codon:yes stop_codon:yes gene_type:complete
MANWNKKELVLPEEFDKIARNAQNAINSVEVLMEIIKKTGDVAKLFLMLSNPAGTIIRLAAEEIIKLCNDFKEIGVFWLLVDPTDPSFGNLNPQTYGLKILQDENGLYQFEPSDPNNGTSERSLILRVDEDYQKTMQLKDLKLYRDPNDKKQGEVGFIPPTPIFYDPPKWELGGYNAATWTGEPLSTVKLPGGILPPQMTPAECLSIMSAAFDDEGDVARFKIPKTTQTRLQSLGTRVKLYTADGSPVNMSNYSDQIQNDKPFDFTTLKSERIYTLPLTTAGPPDFVARALELEQRGEITEIVSSGKPNFSGSSNIEGIEVVAIAALVATSDFTQFVSAWESLQRLFDGAPNFSEMVKKLKAVKFKSDDEELGKDKMVMTNDTRYGEWKKGDFIIGEDSDALGRIDEITEVKTQKRFRDKLNKVYGGPPEFRLISQNVESVDVNPNGTWKEVTTKFKKIGDVNFIAGERIREAQPVPDKESQRNLFAGRTPPTYPITFNYIPKPLKGSALNDNISANDVRIGDVPKYGEILGIDVSAPPSISPNFNSIKIKDMIPGYAGFFDEIIGFAQSLKSFADGADTYIAILLDIIDEYIKYFEDVANKIKAFLSIFTNLPEAGVYWLTIKTFGGNKAIQAALVGSDDPPPDSLKFTAGFLMVSVSGMQGLSSTKGLELLFGQNGLGLEFQEVAPIPEESELDTAVLQLQTQYNAATAAQAELATDVFDAAGLNPPVNFRDATTIQFTEWNNITPNVGDYVLGMKSGCFGQILRFDDLSSKIIVDHIKLGPTITGTTVDEERIVRQYDNKTAQFIEFPYDGSAPLEPGRETSTGQNELLAIDFTKGNATTLVGEGRFTKEVLTNRSSHKPNGKGTTVYKVFQGNENTFAAVEDSIEQITDDNVNWTMAADAPFNTFPSERSMQQQIFKVIDGAVKEPELNTGFNGRLGFFTGDDTIISFTETTSRSSEELAQIFIADVEGRNTEEDGVTRLQIPPTDDDTEYKKMVITVRGDDAITETGQGGIVESYARALDNVPNPENLPADRNLLEDN